MAEALIQLDMSSLEDVLVQLERRGKSVTNDILPAVAEMLVGAVLDEWQSEGHGKWPPFWWQRDGLPKPGGRRWQGDPKLLQDTGVAIGSAHGETGLGWVGPYAEAGTNIPYMVYHASDAPRTKIPYRNPFDIDEEPITDDVAELLLSEIVR
jgi:phage gpG-like protein